MGRGPGTEIGESADRHAETLQSGDRLLTNWSLATSHSHTMQWPAVRVLPPPNPPNTSALLPVEFNLTRDTLTYPQSALPQATRSRSPHDNNSLLCPLTPNAVTLLCALHPTSSHFPLSPHTQCNHSVSSHPTAPSHSSVLSHPTPSQSALFPHRLASHSSICFTPPRWQQRVPCSAQGCSARTGTVGMEA